MFRMDGRALPVSVKPSASQVGAIILGQCGKGFHSLTLTEYRKSVEYVLGSIDLYSVQSKWAMLCGCICTFTFVHFHYIKLSGNHAPKL